MNPVNSEFIKRNTVFAWIALVTVVLLLIPWVAMQITSEVNWDLFDFLLMGLMLFGSASLCVLLARPATRKRRAVIGVIIAVVFVFVWAELAVGIFTDLGS